MDGHDRGAAIVDGKNAASPPTPRDDKLRRALTERVAPRIQGLIFTTDNAARTDEPA
jgi:hypothetical protein